MIDYNRIIESEISKLFEIEGKILIDFMVEVVEPEYNIAFLVFTDSIYSICGAMGSEIQL